ncbi:hypothetical protein D3C85_1593350 [compost metagenome]
MVIARMPLRRSLGAMRRALIDQFINVSGGEVARESDGSVGCGFCTDILIVNNAADAYPSSLSTPRAELDRDQYYTGNKQAQAGVSECRLPGQAHGNKACAHGDEWTAGKDEGLFAGVVHINPPC